MRIIVILTILIISGLSGKVNAQSSYSNSDSFVFHGRGMVENMGMVYMDLFVAGETVGIRYYCEKDTPYYLAYEWVSLGGMYNSKKRKLTLTEDNGVFDGYLTFTDDGVIYKGKFIRKDGKVFDFKIPCYFQ